ncbi:MAG: hypothetical protein Q7K16_03970 [Candidatus Azambacteria bacterium]|nr:hypothetical protein [Candidatus Azambacteria bacterium]
MMRQSRRIYFAHPVNIYNEPIEKAFEELIAHCLAGDDHNAIENPNQPCHQKGYDAYAKRAKESDIQHKGMNYFFDMVLPNCSMAVALPFLDGRMGLGVAGELKWFVEREKAVWIIMPARMPVIGELDEFTENPLNSLFFIRSFMAKEVELLLLNDPAIVVPHEETRLRTWKVYNRVMRPYEEAHLATLPLPEGFYPKG